MKMDRLNYIIRLDAIDENGNIILYENCIDGDVVRHIRMLVVGTVRAAVEVNLSNNAALSLGVIRHPFDDQHRVTLLLLLEPSTRRVAPLELLIPIRPWGVALHIVAAVAVIDYFFPLNQFFSHSHFIFDTSVTPFHISRTFRSLSPSLFALLARSCSRHSRMMIATSRLSAYSNFFVLSFIMVVLEPH